MKTTYKSKSSNSFLLAVLSPRGFDTKTGTLRKLKKGTLRVILKRVPLKDTFASVGPACKISKAGDAQPPKIAKSQNLQIAPRGALDAAHGLHGAGMGGVPPPKMGPTAHLANQHGWSECSLAQGESRPLVSRFLAAMVVVIPTAQAFVSGSRKGD